MEPTEVVRPTGMTTFLVVWAGQLVSTIGSALTGFGLGVWIYETTGSPTLFAFNLVAVILPTILVAPFAGVLVDRLDRRLIMIGADALAGLSTLGALLLFLNGHLQIWHIYIISALGSTASTFQWPAFGAVTTLLVPQQHLGRAGGLQQIGEAVSNLIGPAAAGALFVTAGLETIIAVDLITFVVALATLVAVRFPHPEHSQDAEAARDSFLSEVLYGLRYLKARPGLLGVLIYFAIYNFMGSAAYPLLTPLILEISTPDMLGYVFAVGGLGMVFGTLVMSAWGGTRRRVLTILLGDGLTAVGVMLTGLRPSIPLIAAAGFVALFGVPIANGASQAMWQSKVAPDVQGRVFAARRMIAFSIIPVAYGISGPLYELVFQPLMTVGGPLDGTIVSRTLGVGRGIALMYLTLGMMGLVTVLAALSHPRIRRVDFELPDTVPARDSLGEMGAAAPPAQIADLASSESESKAVP